MCGRGVGPRLDPWAEKDKEGEFLPPAPAWEGGESCSPGVGLGAFNLLEMGVYGPLGIRGRQYCVRDQGDPPPGTELKLLALASSTFRPLFSPQKSVRPRQVTETIHMAPSFYEKKINTKRGKDLVKVIGKTWWCS